MLVSEPSEALIHIEDNDGMLLHIHGQIRACICANVPQATLYGGNGTVRMSCFCKYVLTFVFYFVSFIYTCLCMHSVLSCTLCAQMVLPPSAPKEVMVAFERDFYSVNEGDSVVQLTVIATGATIDSSVSVRVFTGNLSPPSAIGTYAGSTHTRTHTTHTHTHTHTHTMSHYCVCV